MIIPESPGHGRKPWRSAALALGLIGLAGASTWWLLRQPTPKLSVALNTFFNDGEVAYSPEGRMIATPGIRMIPPFAKDFPKELIPEYGASQGIVELRDAATGAKLKDLGDGDLLAATQLDGNAVVLIEIPTGRERTRIEPPMRPNVIHPSYKLRFSPDGRTVVAAGLNGELELLDVPTGTFRGSIPPDRNRSGFLPEIAFSPDSRTLALGATFLPAEDTGTRLAREFFSFIGVHMRQPSIVGQVTFIDVATGRRRLGFDGVQSRFAHLTFSPDGRTLVTDGAPSTDAAAGSGMTADVATVSAAPDNARTLVFWDVRVFPLK
jgi:WD40 repeat protein